METNNSTILSFEDFVKQNAHGQVGLEQPADMMTGQDEIPTADDELTDEIPMGNEMPVPAEEPTGDSSHNVPVHMTDDETGEATAETPAVDANVMIDDEAQKM